MMCEGEGSHSDSAPGDEVVCFLVWFQEIPEVKHFTSWFGLSPDNEITGVKSFAAKLTKRLIEQVWHSG